MWECGFLLDVFQASTRDIEAVRSLARWPVFGEFLQLLPSELHLLVSADPDGDKRVRSIFPLPDLH